MHHCYRAIKLICNQVIRNRIWLLELHAPINSLKHRLDLDISIAKDIQIESIDNSITNLFHRSIYGLQQEI
jgi:hypothetical protein